jgi:hypothetical protein
MMLGAEARQEQVISVEPFTSVDVSHFCCPEKLRCASTPTGEPSFI